MKKGAAEKLSPLFSRVNKKHKKMLKELQKELKDSSAGCVRIAIEKLHDTIFKK